MTLEEADKAILKSVGIPADLISQSLPNEILKKCSATPSRPTDFFSNFPLPGHVDAGNGLLDAFQCLSLGKELGIPLRMDRAIDVYGVPINSCVAIHCPTERQKELREGLGAVSPYAK